MKQAIREQLGKAAYAAYSNAKGSEVAGYILLWDELPGYQKEAFRIEADAVVGALVETILPLARYFGEALLPVIAAFVDEDESARILEKLLEGLKNNATTAHS